MSTPPRRDPGTVAGVVMSLAGLLAVAAVVLAVITLNDHLVA